MATKKNIKEQEQLELGKKLQQFYESGYVNKKQALVFSFYKGIATGFGVFIGGTIVIALLLWFLGLFDNNIPLVSHFIQVINASLQK